MNGRKQYIAGIDSFGLNIWRGLNMLRDLPGKFRLLIYRLFCLRTILNFSWYNKLTITGGNMRKKKNPAVSCRVLHCCQVT